MEQVEPIQKNKTEQGIVYFCKVRIAEKNIDIESKNKRVLLMYKEYLAQYEQPDFTVRASQSEIVHEFHRNSEIALFGNCCHANIATEYDGIESIVIHRKIAEAMLDYQTLLIHGAAIAVDNNCYVFIAPSGTGKTTHIMNWKKWFPGLLVVNGDKPFINVENKEVYGTPWCGKEGMNTNTSVPLAGIICLERGSENSITPISFKEMLPYLFQQTYIPTEQKKAIQAFQYIGKLQSIPCYRLTCNMNMDSAIVAYNGIKKYEQYKKGS